MTTSSTDAAAPADGWAGARASGVEQEQIEEVRGRIQTLLEDFPVSRTSPVEFLGARFDAGLAWVHFPPGNGGLGFERRLQPVIDAILVAAGAPKPDILRGFIGLGMAAPTIATHGSPTLRERLLRPLFTGEEIWCQLFSEPGAGSDLAALSTRAVKDGESWVVNGQKVWSTLAHVAGWGLLLARTDSDVPKHRGITYFVCDMRAPGVEVRPLRQMTGDAEFNEVFLTDVRIPDGFRLGDVNDGWRVSTTTLMHERVAIGESIPARGGGPIRLALRIWRDRGGGSAVQRDRLARLWAEAEVCRLTNLRARELRRVGRPGPEGSVAKLSFANLNQRILELCIHLMGPQGILCDDYAMKRPTEMVAISRDPRYLFLRTRANSIEGGTSEILKTVLAERVLGLPKENRDDATIPWKDLRRSEVDLAEVP